MQRAAKFFRNILAQIALYSLTACAIFGGGDDPAVKNLSVKVAAPPSPFEVITTTNADHLWQSRRTGNTIAINSACLEKNKEDLSSLEHGILEGVDHVNQVKEEKITVDGAPAERTHAEGKTEGVPISIELVTIKKENCTYDLAYVARTVTYKSELEVFNKFVERFHVP